jgi:DNA polymerase/3'-5' exonuclease PolX
MANNIIISEFEKLVSFVQNSIDNLKVNKGDVKVITANIFRLKQIKNALYTIKKYPKKIDDDTIDEFAELPGIGKGTVDRIKEILEEGKLNELKDFKDVSNIEKNALEDLESVVGIGRVAALEFYNMGYKSVQQLKKAIENEEIEVSEKVLLGIKYYGVFEGDIPRSEVQKYYNIMVKLIEKLNKSIKDDNKYVFEICGSYRREKDVSGDIDILVSKIGTNQSNVHKEDYLVKIVKLLKEPLKSNNNKSLLVDDMTDHFETKYMGFSKYKDNKVRRIDIRFISYDSFYSALLYFTGSAEFNKRLRLIAKDMKLKLSEYGLFKETGEKIPIESEYDIFKILKVEYLPPRLR